MVEKTVVCTVFRIAFLTNGRKHPLVQFVVCLTF